MNQINHIYYLLNSNKNWLNKKQTALLFLWIIFYNKKYQVFIKKFDSGMSIPGAFKVLSTLSRKDCIEYLNKK